MAPPYYSETIFSGLDIGAGRFKGYYNSNSDPLRVDFIPGAYLNRNPVYRTAGTSAFLAPSTLPIWPGRVTPGINRGYQMLQPDGRYNQATAAGGPVIHRGDLFPADFQGNAFITEPTGFLVKRRRWARVTA